LMISREDLDWGLGHIRAVLEGESAGDAELTQAGVSVQS